MKNNRSVLLLCSALALSLTQTGCDKLSLAQGVAQYKRTLDAYAQGDTTRTDIMATRHAEGRGATLISAFFGLDNGLPKRNTDRVACVGAGGADGMPIIFSHEVDHTTLEPGDVRVTTRSGRIKPVTCLTLAPADDPGELRTALLAGDLGSADDEPVSVEIIGNVLSLDGTINFKGTKVEVTPLNAGPTLVFAEIVPEAQWALGTKATRLPWGGGSRCPVGTKQVVRVTWGGGIRKIDGKDADESVRSRYKVSILNQEGQLIDKVPFALADLNDGDNNHLLCMSSVERAQAVHFPAGYLIDPRDDVNPETSISITQ
ncbi:hypothetical protein [Asticcacaulis sp. AC402]|uniref:hypothetical protein n=1 Tax=Asticcacaulis sp. AC402 TaxID=1282361 RepID=UPI0003C3C749|nr:hypothetical protein [Asticcacaulis sp. AC402]ESQ75141.1 hypothetical protein ABAC402_10760 [Asticcacaulis sp. AC402]